jgi:hypothetical protein
VTSEGERVNPSSDPVRLARRQLLAQLGAVSAALAVSPALLRTPALASTLGGARGAQTAPAVPADPLTLDTLSAIVAFAVPGDDDQSRHQGVTLPEPGGIAAEAPELLAETLNTYLPVPEIVAFLLEALQTELAGVPLPDGLTALTWLDGLLEADGTVPLAPVVAALANLLAVQVDPASVAGPFLTPFSRLSWDGKAEAWRRFEGELPDLFTVGAPGSRLPLISDILDLLSTLGGLLRLTAGAVLEIAVFASYSEYAVFDPATRTLTGRPVGWELTEYPPSAPVEGWDELIGYYQGRTTADA